MSTFKLHSEFQPTGDQPEAIRQLVEGLDDGCAHQTLLGVTGIGQDVLHRQRHRTDPATDAGPEPQQDPRLPALQRVQGVLPGQPRRVLRQLLRLLPARGVHPLQRHLHREGPRHQRGDREAALSATSALLSGRRDVIVVASISCIYGIGNPVEFHKSVIEVKVGQVVSATPSCTACREPLPPHARRLQPRLLPRQWRRGRRVPRLCRPRRPHPFLGQ